VVCELDCVACSIGVFLGLCFASSVVWAVCQKSGLWWRCSCRVSAGSVCCCISTYTWNFILLCTYLTIQLNGMQTIKMTLLLSIRDTQLVATNRPKPWRKHDSQRYSRSLCHHREITPYYRNFVTQHRLAKSTGADCIVIGAKRPHASPKFGWEDTVRKYWQDSSGLGWGLWWTPHWTPVYHKLRGISYPTGQASAFI